MVTLQWSGVPGATDYVVYYATADKALDKTTATEVDAGDPANGQFAVTGLRNGTSYNFALAAKNLAGESPLSAVMPATPSPSPALAVATFSPADGATAVTRAPVIRVTFNQSVVPGSVSVTTANESCAGSTLQLSSDNFTTCVRMSDAPIASESNHTFTVVPALPLDGSKTYKLRATSGVQEPGGSSLPGTAAATFTTAPALAFAGTTPADGSQGASLLPQLTLTFNRAVSPASLTTNTGNNTCSGSVQLSTASENFLRCVVMTAPPTPDATGTVFTLTPAEPLLGSTAYVLRVTVAAKDSDNVPPPAPLLARFVTDVPLTVATSVPADGAAAVALNASIAVTLSRAVAPDSVTVMTVNTSGVGCTGSLQLSHDDFATCVKMAAAPATTDNTTFALTPASLLLPATTYKLRARNLLDANGAPLAAPYTSAAGFTTNLVLAVASTNPVDGTQQVPLNTGLAVNFNRAVDPASFTVQAAAGPCTGSLQVSADGFNTCVALAAPAATSNNSAIVVQPLALLAPSATYQLRVTAAAHDSDGVAFAGFTSARGFGTTPALAVLAVSPTAGATSVALNAPVVLTFNRSLDPASLTVAADGSCTGSLQVSADGFATCAALGAPVASSNNRTFTAAAAAPFAPQKLYTVRLTTAVRDANQVPLLAQTDAGTFTTAAALTVATLSPADGATGVALNPAVAVTFNRAANPASLTANTVSTSCSGAVQLSRVADNFAPNTCVQLAAQPAASGANTTFTVQPAQPLAANTAYAVRVTSAATDADGVPLSAAFTTATGFVTGPALAIASTAPASGDALVPLNAPIVVTFNKPAQVSSITANAASTACTGSLQVSADNFATCVQMTASPVPGAGSTTFTVQPAQPLAASTAYQIRLTTSARDASGVALAQTFGLAQPFTTNAAIAVSATTPVGNAVPVNAGVSVTFSRAADPASLTANVNGNACAGTFQLSADNFRTCARMLAQPVASNGNQTFTVQPAALLQFSSAYQVRVTTGARDSDGVPLAAAATSAAFTTDRALAVAASVPADGAAGVALNTPIQITFDKLVDPASVVVNTASTACAGTVQVSRVSDNFGTCVRMQANAASADNATFTLQPAAPLDGNAAYRIRVTTALRDAAGVPLPVEYDSATGFVTDVALAVATTTPADTSSSIALNTPVAVNFNKVAANVTTNTADARCTGTLQVSNDNFATCVKMQAQPASTDGGFTWTAQPAAPLDGVSLYFIRVTQGAQDLAGVPLAPAYTSAKGFLTDAALQVALTNPNDGATAVALNAPIAVTFNKAAAVATVTAPTSTTCGASTLQVSSDGFNTCVPMTVAQPAASADQRTFTMTAKAPLKAQTLYKVRATTGVQDPAGVALANAFTSGSGFTTDSALAVSQVTPVDGSTAVPLNSALTVQFNKAITASSIQVAAASGACTGTLQVSANDFGTCLGLQITGTTANSVTVQPAAVLPGSANIQVRVTSGALDAAGVALATAYTSAGFGTDSALGVSLQSPLEGATQVPLNTPVTVLFNKPVQPQTIAGNTVDTTCSGSLQLSADGFTTCVPLAAQPTGNGQAFTIAPASPLQPSQPYQVRVTVGARDAAGVPLGSTFTSKAFTTDAALAVVTTTPGSGAPAVALNTPVQIDFNKPATVSTITTNTADSSCSGSVQLSRAQDNFATCVRMAAAPAPLNGNASFRLQPAALLQPQTQYKLRVSTSAADGAGVPLAQLFTLNTAFTTDVQLAIASTTPADNAQQVARNAPVTVSFNKAVRASSLTANTGATGCTDALQLSADGFQTCVAFTGAPVANGNSFTVTPAAPLQGGATYRLRVLASVVDAAGVGMASDYNSNNGFVVSPALAIASTSPADTATQVARNTSITVNFVRPALIASITTNTADTSCSGTLQLSSNNFASCVQMTSAPLPVNGNATGAPAFTVTPAAPLAGDTQYAVRITPPAKDSDGVPLAATLATAVGFHTRPAMTVASTAPTDGQSSVPLNTGISVTFSRAPDPLTVTANQSGTACTGGIQVSTSLAFGACLQMASTPAASNGGLTFTVQPLAALASSTRYYVRVMGVNDADGVPLAPAFTMASGFLSKGPFQVANVTPADLASAVARNTAITVTLSDVTTPGTVTTNTADTTCSGSLQLVQGGACVQMAGPPVTTDNQTFTLQPKQPLSGGAVYQVKVTKAVKDSLGNPLAAAFAQANGFTTNLALAVAANGFAPAGGSVPRNAAVSVRFNRAAALASITSGTAGACNGTLQLSSDGFKTCAALGAVTTADNLTFSAQPAATLAGGATYALLVKGTVTDSDGIALGADAASPAFTAAPALVVTGNTPADGSTAVALNTPISVTFNKAPNAATLVTNIADTSCSGSLQLSRDSDNFAACVRMAAAPAVSNGGRTFTFTPLNPLDPTTKLLVRVTGAALDADGVPMDAAFTSAGFTTNAAIQVSSVSPAAGGAAVALNTPVSVTFSRAAAPASITINTTDTTCTGAVQLSADPAFGTCVQLASVTPGAGNTVFTLQPAHALAGSTGYFVRVTPAARDADGVPLAANFTTAGAFTTRPALGVASTSPVAGANPVPLNGTISITFNRAAAPASITATSSGSGCGGSVQISADNFAHCLPMTSSTGVASNGGLTFSFTPQGGFAPLTHYLVLVTTGALDADGAPMPAPFLLATSFTSDQLLQLTSAVPADATTDVPLNQAVVLRFNKAIAPATLTSNVGCTGSVRIASAGACADVTIAANGTNDTFTLTPRATLTGGATYALTVTNAVTDVYGVPLSNPLAQATGFTVKPALTLTSSNPISGAALVAANTALKLQFNRAPLASTVSVAGTSACGNASLQLVRQDTLQCVPIASFTQDANNVFTLQPAALLPASTNLKLRVTTALQDSDGVPLAQESDVAFSTGPRLAVIASQPADNQQQTVARNAAFSFTFNSAGVDTSTLITNVGTTACSGSVQLSADPAFGSCVAISSAGVTAVPGHAGTYQVQPAAALPGSTRYYLRVTTAVNDTDGVPLGAQFDTPSGFVTSPALSIVSTTPIDNGSIVPRTLASIAVGFNRPATALTVNIGADTSCSGMVQVSSNGFTSCLPMTAQPVSTDGGQTWSMTPATLLAGSTNYKLRLSNALDSDGVPFAQYTQLQGFTSKPELLVQQSQPSGNNVPINATVSVRFSRAASNVAGASGTSCAGVSLQLVDGSGACVAGVLTTTDNQTFTFAPNTNLTAASTYTIVVTPAVTDSDGTPLAAQYTAAPFTTQPTLAVTGSLPADAAQAQPLNTPIEIDFNKPVDFTSLGTNTADTTCSGTLQLSADNFQTCVKMTAASPVKLSATAARLLPAAPLAPDTQYLVRVLQAALDLSGSAMAADYTTPAGFHTKGPFTVAYSPLDGAAGVARNTPVVLTFSRPAANVTVSTGTACTASVQLSTTNFSSCLPANLTASPDNTTYTLTPLANLPGSANVRVRIRSTVTDADGVPFASGDTTTNGFHTSPQLLVNSTAPAASAAGVAFNSTVTVNFNTPPRASTVTGGCGGSVQLTSGGACVVLGAPVVSNGGATFTFTPSALLTSATQYALSVTSAVTDAQGVPLETPWSSTFTTATAPAAVTTAAPAITLQSASVSWTDTDARYDHANVYTAPGGSGTFTLFATAKSNVAIPLLPFKSVDVRVVAADVNNNEGQPVAFTVTSAFSGTAADWVAGQTVTGVSGNSFRLSWSDTDLVAGVSKSDGTNLLQDSQDALWIAVDTDAAGSDTNGEVRTVTNSTAPRCTAAVAGTGCEIIWPFKADYIIELKPVAGGANVNLRTVKTSNWQSVATDNFNGAVDEVRLSRALLGNPTQLRVALAAVNTSNGYTYGFAPSNWPAATDVTGQYASLTGLLNVGAAAFDLTRTATSLSGAPVVSAPNLVTLSESVSGAPLSYLQGSVHPLSYTTSDASYTLSANAATGVATGVFNFGGVQGPLYFKFMQSGTSLTPEFGNGVDRIWTLGGGSETLPQLAYNVAYSATHAFTINFVVGSAPNASEIRGDALPEFGTAAFGTSPVAVTKGTPSTATVTLTNHDLTASPLHFKAYGSDWAGNSNYEPNANHSIDDDIINSFTAIWNAGDSSTF